MASHYGGSHYRGSHYDVTIVGGGIVGLSVALNIARTFPRLRLLLAEKEKTVGRHQSGHNSGVIHSGIYYKPGSFKAKLCLEGASAMIRFCQEHGLAHDVCGKVIVATREDELPRLDELRERGEANGVVGVRSIGPEQLQEIEPHASGIRALHVPSTGITDYSAVCRKFAELMQNDGGTISTSTEVIALRAFPCEIAVETNAETFTTTHLINCAGLFSDRICRMAGEKPGIMIVPFRGEYYDLLPKRSALVRALIYPVPDPRFPFLGVHFTRRINGCVDAGPNAVLAFRREGYQRSDFSARELSQALAFSGFWRMVGKHWKSGIDEFYRSFSKSAFVRALQRLVPAVREEDFTEGGAGVRAQGITPKGFLVDDFYFLPAAKTLHVLNVPSPAATASIPIGRVIVEMAAKNFNWS